VPSASNSFKQQQHWHSMYSFEACLGEILQVAWCFKQKPSPRLWNPQQFNFDCLVTVKSRCQNVFYELYNASVWPYGIYGCTFCRRLFDFVNYIFLLLCLCILIVMYVLFCTFSFHRANWHSSATLTEVFLCSFLSLRQMPGYNSQRQGTARTLPNC
jgi:hypothetical protein